MNVESAFGALAIDNDKAALLVVRAVGRRMSMRKADALTSA